jgi:hypothetical protein
VPGGREGARWSGAPGATTQHGRAAPRQLWACKQIGKQTGPRGHQGSTAYLSTQQEETPPPAYFDARVGNFHFHLKTPSATMQHGRAAPRQLRAYIVYVHTKMLHPVYALYMEYSTAVWGEYSNPNSNREYSICCLQLPGCIRMGAGWLSRTAILSTRCAATRPTTSSSRRASSASSTTPLPVTSRPRTSGRSMSKYRMSSAASTTEDAAGAGQLACQLARAQHH